MKSRNGLAWFILIIVFAMLACSQAGEIIEPAEATARAEAAFTPTPALLEQADTTYSVGDEVILTSNGPVVPMKETLAAQNAIYFAPTGQIGTITESDNDSDGVTWYRIASPAGTGWVSESQIQPPEPDAGAEDGGDDGETGPETGEAAVALYAVGDELYVIGRGFMVNLLEAPGAINMNSQEQKGALVTVVQITEFEGAVWYLVDGISIPGWLAEENLSLEAP